MPCIHCASDMNKVLYAGLPMRLCTNAECNGVDGFFSLLLGTVIPFNGWFMQYEGSYWLALWHWLTNDLQEA